MQGAAERLVQGRLAELEFGRVLNADVLAPVLAEELDGAAGGWIRVLSREGQDLKRTP